MTHFIKTQTQEKYNELIKHLESQGYMWSDNEPLNDRNAWSVYTTDTCVVVFTEEKRVKYGNCTFHTQMGDKVVTLTHFLKSSKPKKEHRTWRAEYISSDDIEVLPDRISIDGTYYNLNSLKLHIGKCMAGLQKFQQVYNRKQK